MKGDSGSEILRFHREGGFTLIEVMVVVAIVAILGALALPAYQDYVQRGKIPEATSGLSTARIAMEQWYLDHRSYNGAGNPCANPAQWNTKYFTFTCPGLAADTYVIQADGIAGQGMGNFVYTIDQTNAKASNITAPGWPGAKLCWITRKGGTC